MNKRTKLMVAGAAFLGVLGLAGVAGARSEGADKLPRPKPTTVVVQDGTAPGESTAIAVFRNGQVHRVVLPVRRTIERDPDGGTREVVRPDEAAGLAQLPPIDPRLEHIKPTPEQVAEMQRIAGATPMPKTPENGL